MKKVLVLTTILALGMASCKQGKDYEEKKPAEYYDYSAVKRKGCPKCGSHSIAKIDYGLTYFDENGMLLDLDTDEEKLAQALEAMLELDEEAYNKMRENARRTWEEKACAERNYGNWCAALRE